MSRHSSMMRKSPPSPFGLMRVEFAAEPVAASANQHTADIAPAKRGDRRDEIEPALPARQPARQHHDRHTVG